MLKALIAASAHAMVIAAQAGAGVEVCAIYLPGRGATPDALLEGAGVAQPPAMAGLMLEDEVRVRSF